MASKTENADYCRACGCPFTFDFPRKGNGVTLDPNGTECRACVDDSIRDAAIERLRVASSERASSAFEDVAIELLTDGLGWSFQRTTTGYEVTLP